MSKSGLLGLSVAMAALAMTSFPGDVHAQAPGVKERSEAKRDNQSNSAGTARQAQRAHEKRMESGKKAADEYKSSNKDAKAKQKYQDAKKKDGF
jgi:hypothetical protein